MLISQPELDSKNSRDNIPLECLQCGKTHYRTKNIVLRILNGNLKNTLKGCFCSVECRGKYKQVDKIKCSCKQCGDEVFRLPSEIEGNVFCNQSCAAKHFNKARAVTNYCLNCNEPYHPYRGSKRMKFCSRTCQHKFRKQETYKKIEDNDGSGASRNTLRNFLIDRRGRKCEICGINHWLGNPLVVIMDHIDGNSENNSLGNLRLICSNCDTTLPTYKSKNNGNGRSYRRNRYASGLSY